MTSYETIALIVSAVGVVCFAVIFTILYRSYASAAVAEIESGQRDVELIETAILQNARKRKATHVAWEKAKKVISLVAVIVLVAFLAIALVSKFQNGVVMIGGRGVIAVGSGSMSEKHKDNTYLASINNQIQTYDLIVLEKVNSQSELKLYDVISYVNDEGTNIIHRIIGIEQTADGVRYVTRGDSNNSSDKYKPSFEDVVGRYTGQSIPYVGLFITFLQSYSGIVTIAAVIYCLILIENTGEKINKSQNARLGVLEDSIDFLEEEDPEGKLDSSFTETVRFKNFLYTFDENGFVDKIEVPNEEKPSEDSEPPDET